MRILAIIKKLLKELFRDKRTLALMFFAPIFIMWLMSIMFSASTSVEVNLASYQVDTGIIEKMKEVEGVSVKAYESMEAAQSALTERRVDGVMTYSESKGYTLTYTNTDATKTTITRQAFSRALLANQIVQMMENIKALLPESVRANAPLEMPQKMSFSEIYIYGDAETDFFAKMMPILIGFVTFFFVFLISGMALLKERTSGTLDRLLATPVKRLEIVFGYMIVYGIIAAIQSSIIVIAAVALLDLQVVGSVVNVILVNIIFAMVALAFGILLSTFAKSEFQMMQFIPILIIPQLFFSGIISLDAMADWVQVVGKVLPLTYAGDALSKIILNGDGLLTILDDIVVLLAFLIVLTVINVVGLKRYRKV